MVTIFCLPNLPSNGEGELRGDVLSQWREARLQARNVKDLLRLSAVRPGLLDRPPMAHLMTSHFLGHALPGTVPMLVVYREIIVSFYQLR